MNPQPADPSDQVSRAAEMRRVEAESASAGGVFDHGWKRARGFLIEMSWGLVIYVCFVGALYLFGALPESKPESDAVAVDTGEWDGVVRWLFIVSGGLFGIAALVFVMRLVRKRDSV